MMDNIKEWTTIRIRRRRGEEIPKHPIPTENDEARPAKTISIPIAGGAGEEGGYTTPQYL